MTNPQCIGIDLAEQKVLADIAEYGWRFHRLAGLFALSLHSPGDGESEA